MATQQKILFRGDVPTSNSAVYAVPSSTSAVVTNIVVANTTSADSAVTLKMGGFSIFEGSEIPANTSFILDLKQVLNEFDSIEISATTTGVDIHVSGVEIS